MYINYIVNNDVRPTFKKPFFKKLLIGKLQKMDLQNVAKSSIQNNG